MKKVLVFILVLVSTLIFGLKNVEASTAEYECGVGYSTNLVHPRYEMFNPGAPILDKDYLDSLVLTKANIQTYSSLEYTSNSIKEITEKISEDYNTKFGLNAKYNIYSGKLYNNFALNVDYINDAYNYQYFKIYDIMKYKYSITLPNSASFMYYYEDHFSSGYLNALERLSSRKMGYGDFFSTYGTHLITSAIYGGKIEAYFSVLSNKVMFTESVKNTIENQISISASNITGIGNSYNLSLAGKGNFTSSNHISATNIVVKGGNFSGLTNSALSQWQQSLTIYNDDNEIVEDNTALITYSENGLLPLWDILPEEYGDLYDEMRREYNDYVVAEQNKVSKILYNNDLTYSSEVVEEGILTITDSGRFNQSRTCVDLQDEYCLDLNFLKKMGYQNVKLVFTCKIKEVWDGYQWFFIYLDSSETSELLASYSTSIGDGEKISTWTNVSFELNIDIDKLLSNEFVIRYGASGDYEDTWKLKELEMGIVVS